MPELPELAAHAERLTARWAGSKLARFEPLSFTALKTVQPAPDVAAGTELAEVGRRGKHLLLSFRADPLLTFVVHLMQGGRLRGDERLAARPRGGTARWRFEDAPALLLTEAGTERRAGVWVVADDPLTQPPLDELGPEADRLDAACLAAHLGGLRGRLHTVLRDQRVVAGIGRRLANEICHAARLSPFQPVDRLDADTVGQLADAMTLVLTRDLEAERQRDDFGRADDRVCAVHGRTGEDCPVCGATVREVRYRDYTVHYCAACQTGGRALADNTTSKFLR